MQLSKTVKQIAKSPWFYTMGVSVAALINSHINAQRAIRLQGTKARALGRLAKAIRTQPKVVKIKGHVPKGK
jgi:hypothetical protein